MRNAVVVVAGFILVPAASAPPLAAQSDFDRAWPALVQRIERARIAGDAQSLVDARGDCRRLLNETLTDRQRRQARYTLAYADWRLLGHLQMRNHDDRDEWGDEAVDLLRANIDEDAGDVEAHALLGSVWGVQITSAWRGMRLGGRAAAALDAARAIDERNPRFLLLKGMDTFSRPGMFGGGADRAEAWFRSAVGFFEAQPADRPWPDWGRVDAYAWLGRTLARLGDVSGARQQYEKALEIEPGYALVRNVPLPRLDDRD